MGAALFFRFIWTPEGEWLEVWWVRGEARTLIGGDGLPSAERLSYQYRLALKRGLLNWLTLANYARN
jgi:hypothetical protein